MCHQVCLQVSSLSFSCCMAVSTEDKDEILHSNKQKNKNLQCFSSSSLPLLSKYALSASKKAAHGLKAPCHSSLSSVSVLAGVQLNPHPVHIMGQLDWPSLTRSPPFVMGVRACYGGAVYKGKRGRGICGDKTKAAATETWLFLLSCCLFAVEQRPYSDRSGGQVRHSTNPFTSLLWAPECADTSSAPLKAVSRTKALDILHYFCHMWRLKNTCFPFS